MSMMRFYLWRQQILIPTVSQAEEGFYLDSEPVTICDVTAGELKDCLKQAIRSGNPLVPTPETTAEPGSALLESLGLKKWLKFEAEATMYTVYCAESGITFYSTGRGPDRLWRQDPARQRTFESALPVDQVIERIIEDVLSDFAQEQAASSKQKSSSGTLILLPPADN